MREEFSTRIYQNTSTARRAFRMRKRAPTLAEAASPQNVCGR